MTSTERLAHLKSLDVLTSQDVFDLTVIALRLQGCRSEGQNPKKNGGATFICLYRHTIIAEDSAVAPKKVACAAGHHIRDEEYLPSMEGYSFNDVLRFQPEDSSLSIRLNPHQMFMRELQYVHDSYPPSLWEERWKTIAFQSGLKYSPPEGS